ncbi:unnamed protein product, partial [Discosporangium mesarthrocarpum]
KPTVDFFQGIWLRTLESSHPSKEDMTVALAGLAALSPAVMAVCRWEEASANLHRLCVCLESMEEEEEQVGEVGEEGQETSTPGDRLGGFSWSDRGRVLHAQALFLRTMACWAGALGGISSREVKVPTGQTASGSEAITGAGRVEGRRGVPGYVIKRLEGLATVLVENYALMKVGDRKVMRGALEQLWLALAGPNQGDNLLRILSSVVSKGVARAAAMEGAGGTGVEGEPRGWREPRWVAPVDPVTGEADTRLCFLYAEMWAEILHPSGEEADRLLRSFGGIQCYKSMVSPVVYNEVISSVTTIIRRLDLRYSSSNEGSRPLPLQPTDQQLFLNLVTFCQTLLPMCCPSLLLEWLPVLCPEIVERSLERPLVSGFYRLVALLFRESSRADYFEQSPSLHRDNEAPPWSRRIHGSGSDPMDVDSDREGQLERVIGGLGRGHATSNRLKFVFSNVFDTVRVFCYASAPPMCSLPCRYIEWMSVRLGGFRDELLAACAEALLSAPLGLLDRDLTPLVPALKVALRSGVAHLPTALVSMEALEKWHSEAPSLLMPHLDEILPCLDQHIYSAGAREEGEGGQNTGPERARRKDRGQGKGKGKAKVPAGAQERDDEGSLRKSFKRRVVRFLGRLGGRNHVISPPASVALSSSLAWDTTPRLMIEIPYKDLEEPLPLCLDGLLQRVVTLAEKQGSHQTKTLAAECLHAILVYMVGCTATDPTVGANRSKGGEYSKLFRRCFPAMLRLGVDLEETTRKLFSKLSLQLVHWFSQAKTENEDTAALLECLGDGMAAEEGGPLRELCAKGVVEFLTYAIKQSSKKQQAQGPVAVDALLSLVFGLATHPDKNRRLGGCTAFNQLCAPLREETTLIDRYALRMLHVALISLQRAHYDHAALPAADAASAAVDRALRIVYRSLVVHGDRADLLTRKEETRRFPASVGDLVEWTWEKVGSTETRFRRKCMACLLALCPLTLGDLVDPPLDEVGLRQWIGTRLDEAGGGVSEAVQVFEANIRRDITPGQEQVKGWTWGMGDPGQAEEAGEDFTPKLRGWMEILGASTDCYKFAVDTGVITADELFLDGRLASAPSAGAGTGTETGAERTALTVGRKRKARRGFSGVEGDSGRDGREEGDGECMVLTQPHVFEACAVFVERYGAAFTESSVQALLESHYLEGDEGSGHVRVPLDDPGMLPTERAELRLLRATVLRRLFNLMERCMSTTKNPQALADLLVSKGLWGPSMHKLILFSLLWPWVGGLLPRPSDGPEVEIYLPAAAERLLSHWELLDSARRDRTGEEGVAHGLGVALAVRQRQRRVGDLCRWLLVVSLSKNVSDREEGAFVKIPSEDCTRPSFKQSVNSGVDDELTGRVIRAYRAFARVGLLGPGLGTKESTERTRKLLSGLASSLTEHILSLPRGLRPTLLKHVGSALLLALQLGLPPTVAEEGEMGGVRSLLDALGDERPANVNDGDESDSRAGSWATGRIEDFGEGCVTRGTLLYRRFPEILNEALLTGGRTDAPWNKVCSHLIGKCLSSAASSPVITQAFGILEGLMDFQLQRISAPRPGMVSIDAFLSLLISAVRKLLDHPYWRPPMSLPHSTQVSVLLYRSADGSMLVESLSLCYRLLSLSAADAQEGLLQGLRVKDRDSRVSGGAPDGLLEMCAGLVGKTLECSSSVVTPAIKSDALKLVPFLLPCLTKRAHRYCQFPGGHGVTGSSGQGSDIEKQVLLALEEMMATHFPIDNSHEPKEGSEEATVFALLLRGLLDAFARSGNLGLLELLFATLCEGNKHAHYRWVSLSLNAFVSGLDLDAKGVPESVFGFCMDRLDGKIVHPMVKAVLFDKVCSKMLRRCPLDVLTSLFTSEEVAPSFVGGGSGGPIVKRLTSLVKNGSTDPLLSSCCFSLLEVMYDTFPLDVLEGPIAKAQGGPEGELKEITKVRAENTWDKRVCPGRDRGGEAKPLRWRRSALSCVCTVIRVTQKEERFFDDLLWADELHDKGLGSVLSLVVDLSKAHVFEVKPPFFPTVRLHSPPTLASRVPGKAGNGGLRVGSGLSKTLTASVMLSQSSLAGARGGLHEFPDSHTGTTGTPGPLEDYRETYSSQ